MRRGALRERSEGSRGGHGRAGGDRGRPRSALASARGRAAAGRARGGGRGSQRLRARDALVLYFAWEKARKLGLAASRSAALRRGVEFAGISRIDISLLVKRVAESKSNTCRGSSVVAELKFGLVLGAYLAASSKTN